MEQQQIAQQNKFTKFTPLVKIDEKTHTVYGLVTAETPDKEGEIAVYEDTKKQYELWSAAKAQSTKAAGQDVSYGNVRLQHSLEMGGKVSKPITFDDEAKQIYIATEPVDDDVFSKIKKGFFTGFSHGGDYLYRNCADCGTEIPIAKGRTCPSCKKTVFVKYAPVVAEISYVDNSCHPDAVYTYVKSDGTSEMRKFASKGAVMEQTEKAVLSEEMLAQINAAVSKAVGDSTATVVESVTAAMKKASTTPEQEREAKVVALKATIDRANKVQTWLQKHVEAVLTKQIKAANGESELQKGMYDVSNFASILCNVSYLQQSAEWEAAYEDDASPIPEKLQAHLEALAETFLAMAREEVGELVSASAERKGANKMLKLNTDALAKAGTEALAKAAKSAVDHVATIKKAISDHTDEANKACKAHADSMSKAHSDHVEKMTKMHKAHADDMSEHVGKLAKILGAEEAQEEGDNDPKPATVTETPNIQKSASGDDLQKLIAAEVAKAVATAVEKARSEAQEETLKALLGDEAVEEMLAKAKKSDDDADDKDEKDGKKEAKKAAEAGVGTRTPVVLSGAGAVVKVMPVAKSQDTPQQTQQAAVEITADVAAAALSGDTTAGLALMKSARPTEGVPVTVAAALGSVKR